MMGIMVPETCWASNKICNKNHLLHLVGILFPHIVCVFNKNKTMEKGDIYLFQFDERPVTYLEIYFSCGYSFNVLHNALKYFTQWNQMNHFNHYNNLCLDLKIIGTVYV